jgi:hypothetical protein
MGQLKVQVVDGDEVLGCELLPEDSYVIVCGQRSHVAHKQVFANGTHILTVKPIREGGDG